MSTSRSRLGDPGRLVPEIQEIAALLFRAVGTGAVPQTTIGLVHLRAGQLVGDDYLMALHAGNLRRQGESEERIAGVAGWRDERCYGDAERAALELVEAVLTANPAGERVPDELFARVREHYDERELATLITAIGQVCFFVPLALIGKPIPGVPPAEQWRP